MLAGKEYGSGSSRDWAAKGTSLLGVRAVIAESFERIHRSNLVGMGVLPLQFADGENAESLGLTGEEIFAIAGLAGPLNAGELPRERDRQRRRTSSSRRVVRIDTPKEARLLPPRRDPAVRAAPAARLVASRVMQIRAAVLEEFGKPLVVHEVGLDGPRPARCSSA